MALNIKQKLSYGMYAVTSVANNKAQGCIANCAVQITSEPATFAVSINHDNYTNECIKNSGKFAISVLAVDCDPALIGLLGFKSGRDVDKFASIAYRTVLGLPVIADSIGYIVCEVIDTMETSTHTVFLGRLMESETLDDREPMTYEYYHRVIKGSSPKNAPTYVSDNRQDQGASASERQQKKRRFVCTVCGYEYEGDELPDDIICPICGVGKELFTEVK